MVLKIAPKHPTTPSSRTLEHDVPTQAIADYETALNATGYGKFSQKALGACVLAFFTTGIENCVMSYVLPAAKCDLALTTYQAGLVNMAFMCGGVASAFFWGIVSDVVGRRNALSLTLLANGIVTIAQSFVSDYQLLIAARSINGFLIGGPSTLVFPYMSDLVGEKKRQMYLNVIGASFVSAWLIIPAIAWLIIPVKSEMETILPIHSWRLFLLLSGLPGLLSGFWVLWLPESPRLLADTNRSEEALIILKQMHKSNIGGKHEYMINKIITDDIFVSKTLTEQSRTKQLFAGVLKDMKMLVSKPLLLISVYILFDFFSNMAAGFGLNLWIPELLLRMQGKECKKSHIAGAAEIRKLFEAANMTNWNDFKAKNEHLYKAISLNEIERPVFNGKCNSDIRNDVFISGLIVGACCMLGNALCVIVCTRGGPRGVHRSAIGCTLACALACGCLAACVCSCTSSNQVAVAAAAVLNSASLNGNVLLMRLLLIALPPKLGTLGVCWGAWWGRAGGVASNLAVGVLLDYSCPAPFVSVAAVLSLSIITIILIKPYEAPTNEDKKDEENAYIKMSDKNETLDRYISTHM